MFAYAIANMAIIFIPIYMYFRTNYALADKTTYTLNELLVFITGETIVGAHLLLLSTEFLGIPVDTRALFFSISMTYFGWKITIPSMLTVELLHLYLTGHATLFRGLGFTLVFGFSLYGLNKLAAKKFDKYGQLVILVLFNVILRSLIAYHDTNSFQTSIMFFMFFSIFSMVATSGLYYLMNDLRILRERSDYDYLTRLLNVRKFKEHLAHLDTIGEKNVSIAVIDLDLFKKFNDTYGHDAGDKILWGVAQVFSAYSAPNALAYRVGGEEFAIVMKDMTRKDAELLIVDIMDNVVNRPIPLNRDQLVTVTLSAGLAFFEEGESATKLWKRADRAMYHSKENGRNQLTTSVDKSEMFYN